VEKLLTVPQVSDLLSVSRSQVYKWVHYNFVPHVKIGVLVRFRMSEIDRWVKGKRRKGRSAMRIEIET
jgi:excisionase family DNA binding protein